MLMTSYDGQVAANTVRITPVNEVYVRVDCEDYIARELEDRFKFDIPNARFHPKVKAKIWDGKIRLFSFHTRLIYRGLAPYIQEYCEERELGCELDPRLLPHCLDAQKDEMKIFVEGLHLPSQFEMRDYQIDAFTNAVVNGRGLFLLPTGAGKSMIIYWLVRYYKKKTLIVVDSINLVNQMFSDFKEYAPRQGGFSAEKNIHVIHYGKEKHSEKPVYITTFQSAAKQPKEWFKQFGLVIGDEAHQYDAKSFKTIMEALTTTKHRFGFTGTLTGTKTNQMVLEGLFGRYYKSVTTRKLIDDGYLSHLKIRCVVLKYTEAEAKAMYKANYQDEITFINTHVARNNFIKRLVLSKELKGNTLLLFQRIEQHGIPLHEAIKAETSIPVYYVSGMIEGEEREEIRKIVNTHKDSITVASVGTFSKGVNIPNINNIVVASPTKSQVRVLQSIGRGLRKTETKTECVVYDIADDLSRGAWKNYTLKHFISRVTMYIKEEFPYQTYKIDLK